MAEGFDIPELVGKTIADARIGGFPWGIKLTMTDGTVAQIMPAVEYSEPVAVSNLEVRDGDGARISTRRVR